MDENQPPHEQAPRHHRNWKWGKSRGIVPVENENFIKSVLDSKFENDPLSTQELDFNIKKAEFLLKYEQYKSDSLTNSYFAKIIIPSIATIAPLIALAIGFFQFNETIENTNKQFKDTMDNTNRQFDKTMENTNQSKILESQLNLKTEREKSLIKGKEMIFAKKIEYYDDALRVTAAIRIIIHDKVELAYNYNSNRSHNDNYSSLRKEFESLYWSKLPVIESDEVKNAMIAFRSGLFYIEHKYDTPEIINNKQNKNFNWGKLKEQYGTACKSINIESFDEKDETIEKNKNKIIESLSILVSQSLRKSLRDEVSGKSELELDSNSILIRQR